MQYFDIYLYIKPEAKEGHGPEDIYAHVEVLDPNDGITVLAYLCRINEDQYKYMVENNIDFRTWDTLPTTGNKSRIKVKIKDKEGNDKKIPTVTFGGNIQSPNGTVVEPNTNIWVVKEEIKEVIPSKA